MDTGIDREREGLAEDVLELERLSVPVTLAVVVFETYILVVFARDAVTEGV